jgi:serine O-acetyltransferase
VDRLAATIRRDRRMRRFAGTFLPDRAIAERIVERTSWLMFPGFFGPRDWTPDIVDGRVRGILADLAADLRSQVAAALRYERIPAGTSDTAIFQRSCHDCDREAARITGNVLNELAHVRDLLRLDVQAAVDGDPALGHADEAIFCYPGLRAIMVHRLAHELVLAGVPLLPRILAEIAHSQTGIDLHPGARIGRSFFIDHGTGVVVGETTVIGDHCAIYQGVTLGAKRFPRDASGRFDRTAKRHPTLEDHVTVYAGATILGGDTVIGAGSVVNGGGFVTDSVPPGHVVRAPSTEVVLKSNPAPPPANWSI